MPRQAEMSSGTRKEIAVEGRFSSAPRSGRQPVISQVPGGGAVLRDVKIMRLRNGMTLAVKQDGRFPQAFFRLEIKAGTAWERPEEAGISHLIEHMAFRPGDDGADRYEQAERSGGAVYANTGRDYTTFFAEFPSESWQEALKLLHGLVFEMPLTQEALDAERGIVLAELREDASRADRAVFDLTMAKMFAGTPYQNGVIGTEGSLSGITIGMVREYVRRRYVPRDMVLSIVGDVEPGHLLEAADALFGGHANVFALAPAPAVHEEDIPRGLSVAIARMQALETSVCMAFPIPVVRPRFAAALTLLAELLDGSDAALLKRRLCFEAKAARHVQVSYEVFERAGVFLIEAATDRAGVESCLRTLAATLSGISVDDFTDAQIAQVRSRVADANAKSLERADVLAEIISDENLHAPASASGWIPVPDFRDIGREQIRQVMELCFRPDAAAVTVVTGDMDEGPVPDEEVLRSAVAEGWPGLGLNAPASGEDGPAEAGPEIVKLGEGRTLALLPDASLPFVAATLCFSGGEALAAEARLPGMELLTRILPLGLEGRTRQETAAWLYERSASFHACRSVDDLCLNMVAPKRFAPELLALMREAMERPLFHEEDFEHEKMLSRMEEDRMLRYFQIVRRLLLKGGPHKSMDWPSDPAALSLPKLEALWGAQVSRPWTLCVAGDLDRDVVVEFARTLPPPSQKKIMPPAAGWEEFGPFSSGCGASEQAVYALFFRAPGASSPYRPAVELLLRCLNGGGGLLYRALRQERQLCYSAEALDWCEGEAGLVGIFLLTSPEYLDEAAGTLEVVIGRLCEEELSEEEVARGKAAAAMLDRAREQRIEDRAFETARQLLRGRGIDFASRHAEGLQAVTAGQMLEAARRFFILEEAAELCVEPEEGMEG